MAEMGLDHFPSPNDVTPNDVTRLGLNFGEPRAHITSAREPKWKYPLIS
jgi:hypothetical protein